MANHIQLEHDSLGISAPAEKLLDFLGRVLLGGGFEPQALRRTAKANADSKIITAKAEAEAKKIASDAENAVSISEAKTKMEIQLINEINKSDISDTLRTAIALNIEKIKREQTNFENVINKSFEHLSDSAQPEKIEFDWIFNFYEKASKFSDPQIQQLWARILAGEANKSGSFSLQAMHILSIMTKTQAEIFAELCNFSFMFNTVALESGSLGQFISSQSPLTLSKIDFDLKITLMAIELHTNYVSTNISNCFGKVKSLESLGLLIFESIGIKKPIINHSNQLILASFHDHSHFLFKPNLPIDSIGIKVGNVSLSQVGLELYGLLSPNCIDGFKEVVSKMIIDCGCTKLDNSVIIV